MNGDWGSIITASLRSQTRSRVGSKIARYIPTLWNEHREEQFAVNIKQCVGIGQACPQSLLTDRYPLQLSACATNDLRSVTFSSWSSVILQLSTLLQLLGYMKVIPDASYSRKRRGKRCVVLRKHHKKRKGFTNLNRFICPHLACFSTLCDRNKIQRFLRTI